jgi:diamine N-acetyltransferase
MQQFQIRRANENDIAVINQLANKIWHEHYPGIITVEQINFMLDKMYSRTVIQEQMQNGYTWLLGFDNNTTLGFLSCNKVSDGNYFLNKLYVATTNQHKGIGFALLDK